MKTTSKAIKKPVKITELINSFQDVLKLNGETQEQFDARSALDSPFQKANKAAESIALAYNEGKVLKYGEGYWLYFPRFWVRKDSSKPSGFAFSYYDWTYSLSHSRTYVGSRLCFNSDNHAVDAGNKFPDIYEQLLNG